MKKFKLLALAIVLGTASLFANVSESKVPVQEIRKQIVELVNVVIMKSLMKLQLK